MRYVKVASPKRTRLAIPSFAGGVNCFSAESVTPPNRAKECYNFCFENGELTPGYGLTAFPGFELVSLKSLYAYKRTTDSGEDTTLIGVSTAGEIYALKSGETSPEKLTDVTLSFPIGVVNYRLYGEDVALICSPSGMLVYNGTTVQSVMGAPDVTSLTLHNERLFVTTGGEANSVWFSDDLDPTNWDASLSGGGFIRLIDERGKSRKVISFGGYVYVFRDGGITRISAYGAQTEFSVSHLFVSSGRIYPDSVVPCGDRVLLAATDGLYLFDGVSTVKILGNLDGLMVGGAPAAAYCEGKYYLSFRTDPGEDVVGCEAGEYVNNAMLILSVNDGNYSISRGMDISSFAVVGGEIIAVTANGTLGKVAKCAALFGTPLVKKWVVPKTDLNDFSVKCVRELHLTTTALVTVTLRSDTREKAFAFKPGPAPQKRRTAFFGKRIGMTLTSTGEGSISRPYLVFTKREGR